MPLCQLVIFLDFINDRPKVVFDEVIERLLVGSIFRLAHFHHGGEHRTGIESVLPGFKQSYGKMCDSRLAGKTVL